MLSSTLTTWLTCLLTYFHTCTLTYYPLVIGCTYILRCCDIGHLGCVFGTAPRLSSPPYSSAMTTLPSSDGISRSSQSSSGMPARTLRSCCRCNHSFGCQSLNAFPHAAPMFMLRAVTARTPAIRPVLACRHRVPGRVCPTTKTHWFAASAKTRVTALTASTMLMTSMAHTRGSFELARGAQWMLLSVTGKPSSHSANRQ